MSIGISAHLLAGCTALFAFATVQAAIVPMCPGLTLVTAVSSQEGDYESIKTVESATDQAVRLRYSAEVPTNNPLDAAGPARSILSYRDVRRQDLKSSNLYQHLFAPTLPEAIPGTTAVGTSSAVLAALKTQGRAELAISGATSASLGTDRNVHPNLYDFLKPGAIERVEAKPVMVSVTVNDEKVTLPAIHARGELAGDEVDFLFLDDPDNPLALSYRIGAEDPPSKRSEVSEMCESMGKISPDMARMLCGAIQGKATQKLQVVKITYRCAVSAASATDRQVRSSAPAAGDLSAAAARLEQSLVKTGKIDVYDVYFSFNSDRLRPESEPRLKEIGDVLAKHPDWKLNVHGHTDNVASDSYNLDLSKRRAAAVKEALVSRYRIDGGRLATSGFGESQPKDTNETLDGRARNRRVELVRVGG